MSKELAKGERRAIKALEKIAESWPNTLWLYSASGTLYVMRKRDGKKAFFLGGGVDPDYIVISINIESDGGDW
jgi:hypothetical protein